MKRSTIVLLVCLPPAAMFALCLGCSGYVLYVFNSSDDLGSPKLAAEWEAKLQTFKDFDDALNKDSQVQGTVLPNGEWVMGYCNDSHAKLPGSGGGTLVVKDSRGAVRVFFGHVCGNDVIESCCHDCASLDMFYERLGNLVEQPSK
jgi:hypothetical protein